MSPIDVLREKARSAAPAVWVSTADLASWMATFAAPEGTRLVLMSDELMDELATPSEDRRATWEWGEPDEHGWYSPTFTLAASSKPDPSTSASTAGDEP